MERRNQANPRKIPGTVSIGDIAREAGVTVDALRYYEREGILPAAGRGANGYRRFRPEAARWVRFVRWAGESGLSLDESRRLLKIWLDEKPSCDGARAIITGRAEALEREADDKRVAARALRRLAKRCTGRDTLHRCPILAQLRA